MGNFIQDLYKEISDDIIHDEIFSESDKLIKESLGIQSDAVVITNQLDKRFREESSKYKFEPSRQYKGVSYKQGDFEFEYKTPIYEVKFTVEWKMYNVFMNFGYTYRLKNNFNFNKSNNTMGIVIVLNNGNIKMGSYHEGLLHEIRHALDLELYKKLDKPSDEKLIYASDVVGNKTNKFDELTHVVSAIYYVSSKFEQRAFENGTYSFLIRQNDYEDFFEKSSKHTQLYTWAYGLKDYIPYLKSLDPNNQKLCELLSYYGYQSLGDLIDKTKQTIHQLIVRLSRARIKAHYDFIENNNITVQPEPPKFFQQESTYKEFETKW